MVVPLAFGWRHLLFANCPVDAATVDDRLPDALDVQTHGGDAWLSVVPLLNVDTRPRRLPASVGVAVPEVNLRTYVTREGEPGVYFFSLDAGGLLTALGARLTHHLPYYYARIDAEWSPGDVRFRSRRRHPGARPASFAADYWTTGESFTAEPGSLAEFLVERRRLYTQDTSGRLRYTDVSHELMDLYPAGAAIGENALFEANGFDEPEGGPTLYYCPGVDVVTSASQRWDGAPSQRRAALDRNRSGA